MFLRVIIDIFLHIITRWSR